MRNVREAARDVPVIADVDVLVVGSGPGGLGAALAAARAGVKTMVVERFGCLGGNITVVGVESIAWYRREGTAHSRPQSLYLCCAVTGQGAGVAAAVSIKDGVSLRDVSVARLQAELLRQGARIH
jgi:monoamine oxidase